MFDGALADAGGRCQCMYLYKEIFTLILKKKNAPTHSWKPTILQDAELVQNVMQDHKSRQLAELFEN